MRENGFREERRARHGTLWFDGLTRVMLSDRWDEGDQRALKNKMADVRRAITARETAVDRSKPLTFRINIPPTVAVKPAGEPQKPRGENSMSGNFSIVKDEIQTPKKITRRKWNGDERFRLYDAAKALLQQGKSSGEITATLQDMGFKSPDGNRLTTVQVSGILSYIKQGNKKLEPKQLPLPVAEKPPEPPQPQVTTRAPASGALPAWALALLTDPHLSADERIVTVLKVAEMRA